MVDRHPELRSPGYRQRRCCRLQGRQSGQGVHVRGDLSLKTVSMMHRQTHRYRLKGSADASGQPESIHTQRIIFEPVRSISTCRIRKTGGYRSSQELASTKGHFFVGTASSRDSVGNHRGWKPLQRIHHFFSGLAIGGPRKLFTNPSISGAAHGALRLYLL